MKTITSGWSELIFVNMPQGRGIPNLQGFTYMMKKETPKKSSLGGKQQEKLSELPDYFASLKESEKKDLNCYIRREIKKTTCRVYPRDRRHTS